MNVEDKNINIEKINEKSFELNYLPELYNAISDTANEIKKEIIDNYIMLTNNARGLIIYSCENNLSKPITMYNLFYYLEMFFKMKLLTKYSLKIEEVDKYEHDISGMINYIKNHDNINFDGLMYLLRKIRDKNNKGFEYSKYYHFKYNKAKDSDELIFNLKLTDEDIKNVKDVIKWLDSHM